MLALGPPRSAHRLGPRHGTLVVEYEADADYHYDHEPIASLKAPSGAPRSDFT